MKVVKLRFLIGLVLMGFIAFFGFIGSTTNNDHLVEGENLVNISDQLGELRKVAVEVRNLYPNIGPGIEIDQGFAKLMKAKEGNCYQESYIFARKALQLGYKDVDVIGLYDKDGINHLVVNVRIKGKNILFDPSNGVYYQVGFWEIMQNPNLVHTMIGEPEEVYRYYTTKEFFSNISRITNDSNLNYSERNLLTDQKLYKVISNDIYEYPNNVAGAVDQKSETYLAGISPLPNEITIEFHKPIQFYRIYLKWYSNQDYARDFQVFYGNQLNSLKELVNEKDNKINSTMDYQYVSSAQKSAKYFKIKVNKTNGQDRLLLSELGIY